MVAAAQDPPLAPDGLRPRRAPRHVGGHRQGLVRRGTPPAERGRPVRRGPGLRHHRRRDSSDRRPVRRGRPPGAAGRDARRRAHRRPSMPGGRSIFGATSYVVEDADGRFGRPPRTRGPQRGRRSGLGRPRRARTAPGGPRPPARRPRSRTSRRRLTGGRPTSTAPTARATRAGGACDTRGRRASRRRDRAPPASVSRS